MKKAILVALGLASSAFCGYTGNLVPTQATLVQGCGSSANSTGLAIQLPGISTQFLITSTNPLFSMAYSLALEATSNGRHVNIDYPPTTTTMQYLYNGACTVPVGFNAIEEIIIAP